MDGLEEELSAGPELTLSSSSQLIEPEPVPIPMPTLSAIQEEITETTERLELAKEDAKRAKIEFDEQSKVKKGISENMEQRFQDVLKSLNSLKRNDIAQLKSMQKPPPTVKQVLAAVCILKGIKPDKIKERWWKNVKVMDYWGPSKKMLADNSFLQSLKDFDKDNIPPEVMTQLRREYFNRLEFQPRFISMTSSAAAGLCVWVRAVDDYDKLIKETAPQIKTRLLEVERILKETALVLTTKEKEIEELEDKLVQLYVQFLAVTENTKKLANKPEPDQLMDRGIGDRNAGAGDQNWAPPPNWGQRVIALVYIFMLCLAALLFLPFIFKLFK